MLVARLLRLKYPDVDPKAVEKLKVAVESKIKELNVKKLKKSKIDLSTKSEPKLTFDSILKKHETKFSEHIADYISTLSSESDQIILSTLPFFQRTYNLVQQQCQTSEAQVRLLLDIVCTVYPIFFANIPARLREGGTLQGVPHKIQIPFVYHFINTIVAQSSLTPNFYHRILNLLMTVVRCGPTIFFDRFKLSGAPIGDYTDKPRTTTLTNLTQVDHLCVQEKKGVDKG